MWISLVLNRKQERRWHWLSWLWCSEFKWTGDVGWTAGKESREAILTTNENGASNYTQGWLSHLLVQTFFTWFLPLRLHSEMPFQRQVIRDKCRIWSHSFRDPVTVPLGHWKLSSAQNSSSVFTVTLPVYMGIIYKWWNWDLRIWSCNLNVV
jgi:hypothetical protein